MFCKKGLLHVSSMSKHKYLLFIIVRLAFHSWWTLSQEYSRFNQLKKACCLFAPPVIVVKNTQCSPHYGPSRHFHPGMVKT